jgi:hypothetical protein
LLTAAGLIDLRQELRRAPFPSEGDAQRVRQLIGWTHLGLARTNVDGTVRIA